MSAAKPGAMTSKREFHFACPTVSRTSSTSRAVPLPVLGVPVARLPRERTYRNRVAENLAHADANVAHFLHALAAN